MRKFPKLIDLLEINIINESNSDASDPYQVQSDVRTKTTSSSKGTEKKFSSTSHQKNLKTGREVDMKDVSGEFANGVFYGSEDYKDS